jgi:two-component system chemotaxis response regulator CheY
VAPSRAVGSRRILVVDDDQDIRELLLSVLRDDGYEAVAASNGREALAALDRFAADLIVLDLMMPVMDGWTFAKRMHEKWDIPILIISAANDIQRHAATVHAAAAVTKPFDIETLMPRIARLSGGAAN